VTCFSAVANDGAARAGILHTAHGDVETPIFMPVGTQASVKGLTPGEIRGAGVRMLLANAYHCYLRPGQAVIAGAGGLHKFMSWDRAILTDSGGFQVFSLAALSRVDDEGYHFASHIDGSRHTFTPESVVALQAALQSDVAMTLDDCAPAGVDLARAQESAARTERWAARARPGYEAGSQLGFAIVQGSTYEALRRRHARRLTGLDFAGYAIGGLWVGESKDVSLHIAAAVCSELPAAKPRYLMGVGTPEDLLAAIAFGVDMFDCVYPTRSARHGLALTSAGRLNLRNARFTRDFQPLDPECGCAACAGFSRAYLAHCLRSGEHLGARLLSLHNVAFLTALACAARRAIMQRRFAHWQEQQTHKWALARSAG
jgi:queuine tRNA-ribosyltransferase